MLSSYWGVLCAPLTNFSVSVYLWKCCAVIGQVSVKVVTAPHFITKPTSNGKRR